MARSPASAKDTPAEAEEYARLKRQVAVRLADVRAQFQEAVATYSVKVQGRLAEVGDALADDGAQLALDDRRAREKALRDALALIERVDMKPAKGRRRDLKAVQELAEQLVQLTEEW